MSSDDDDINFLGFPSDPVGTDMVANKKRKLGEDGGKEDESKYKIFSKPGYKRMYPDNCTNDEFPVYVEGLKQDDKIGNKNPLLLSKIFKQVKGIHESRRLKANKIMLVFKQASAANDFLKHSCLEENSMKAYIPASSVEAIGVVRYIPKETSNKDLFHKLTADAEIITVRRFMKKEQDELVPLTTISVTFVGTVLPQYIYLDNWRYKVFKYVPPLMQCYKCLKFNHSAKICRSEQVCSKCNGKHNYKECTSEIVKCSNCQGDHFAISKLCPIKIEKQEIHKNKNNSNKTYASLLVKNNDFPSLPQRSQNVPIVQSNKIKNKPSGQSLPIIVNDSIENIVNNSKLIDAVVKTLIALGNSNQIKTSAHIREELLKNLSSS
ncbi:hypothetical protein ABMA27_007585 [Loxostege sticticalis]|uniref:Uncharacterized protein n=1 Tax=Loxostege sticticalis TaxID=481309 RepID=A0ABR3HFY1_LOXSC